MATGKVSLKLLIDKRYGTVLFAEAGKDFVDFLLHILVLPVGQVVQLLAKTGTMCSLNALHSSVEKLNNMFINSSKKDACLKPKAPAFLSEIPCLLPDTSSLDPPPKTYYRCSSRPRKNCWNSVAEDCSALCSQCSNPMRDKLTLVGSASKTYYRCHQFWIKCGDYVALNSCERCPQCDSFMTDPVPAAAVAPAAESDGKGGFVLGEVAYMVMDDLTVKLTTAVSTITLLKKFNVEDLGLIEEKVVSLGIDEGIKLLETSLHSWQVLTDVFLGVKPGKM